MPGHRPPLMLSVIIPVWNEAKRVESGIRAFELFRSTAGPCELLVVDDGSDDDTVGILEQLRVQGLRVIREPHRGKGAAIRAGVQAASGDRLVLTDIDWSVAPRVVAGLLGHREDLVVASREGPDARRIGEPSWRHLLGRAFNQVVQQAILAGVQDSQCGCKVIDANAARVIFDRVRVQGWAYDVEVLTIAHLHGYTVREVPVVWRHEPDSRVRPVIDGLRMLRDVATIARRARTGEYR